MTQPDGITWLIHFQPRNSNHFSMLCVALTLRRQIFAVASMAWICTVVFSPLSRAQDVRPIENPIATPVDTPAPSPGPSPDLSPMCAGGTRAYWPTVATVRLTPNSSPLQSASTNGLANNYVATNAVATDLPAQALTVSSPGVLSNTDLSAQPESATITLTYEVACAGEKVLVAPLDGGKINGSAGGQWITVAADGTISFSFQAPSRAGRFHVVTHLRDSEISFPFTVARAINSTPNL